MRFALAGVLWLLAAVGAAAQTNAPATEQSVKAAYLYKFTGFVEWPANAFGGPADPLVIGVAGADAVYAELELVVAGRTAQGRPLVARRALAGDAPAGLHVLYIGAAAIAERARWLRQVHGRPVLVVTDDPDGLVPGAALNFVTIGGRVRFEASLGAAELAGLRLSSRLLAVAERVVQAP